MPNRPSFHFHQHAHQQEEKPWLKYPGAEKPSNGPNRLFSPPHKYQSHLGGSPDQLALPRPQHSHNHSHSPRPETPGHKHERSSSRLHSSNNSNASLPMSLADSNSSSDSLGHHAQLHSQRSPSSSTKARTLSDELSFALQSSSRIDTNMTPSTTKAAYPSPITPSDLLGIPDPSPSSSFSSPPSSSVSSPSQEPRAESPLSTGHKLRPSPLSINTTFNNHNTFPSRAVDSPTSARGSFTSEGPGSPRVNLGAASGSRTPPLPRLSHSSSASNSSYSNSSSPTSATAPCSALCSHHSKGHNHHSHSHHHHHHCSHHRQDRQHRRHNSCHHASPGHKHGSRPDKASKSAHRYSAPLFTPEQEDELRALNSGEGNRLDVPLADDVPLEIERAATSTAVTIVGSTPAFGIGAFRDQREREDSLLGLDATEPPKKRQRSTAAVILGAAVETVIFTSAVALSAYQLLTGKGKQQLDGTITSGDESNAANAPLPETSAAMVHIKSAPMNIPTRTSRHNSPGQLGKSLHSHSHHHKSKHHKSRHGLSTSLPHAYEDGNLMLPDRPNTGTEDNDEQFLRMEAQLNSLIAEGKRALTSRIPDLTKA